MPKITKAEVVTNPIALGQEGEIVLQSVPTKGGSLAGTVSISSGNDVFLVPQSSAIGAKEIAANPNSSTSFHLERRPGPGLTSPHSVIFFINVKEAGVAAQAKRQRLVDILG